MAPFISWGGALSGASVVSLHVRNVNQQIVEVIRIVVDEATNCFSEALNGASMGPANASKVAQGFHADLTRLVNDHTSREKAREGLTLDDLMQPRKASPSAK